LAIRPSFAVEAVRPCEDARAVRPHPVLIAPDSFKGTLSAARVAAAIGRGLEAEGVPVVLCPVADGV